jgi:cysteine synthase A
MTIVDTDRKFRDLGHLIGNTPLLAIECLFRGTRRTVYAKAENLNMTGSIKDRMALQILRQGYARGLLTPGAPIAEATSGNGDSWVASSWRRSWASAWESVRGPISWEP